jgi:two-component system, NarL family, response regulator NreC
LTTVVLADDHPLIREGVRAILEDEPGISIVGEVADGLEVVGLVERMRPEVLILDLVLPGLSGLEITRQLRKRAPRTRVLILSMHDEEFYVLEALRNGALGFALKDSDVPHLIQAVRDVAAGRHYLSPQLLEPAIVAYAQKTGWSTSDKYDALTTREREVLQLAVQGHGNTKIATRLGISPRTVESHRANFMRKLGLKSEVDLVRYGQKKGLFNSD